MIYELRQYTIEPGTRDFFHTLFAAEVVPLFHEVGITTVGFWEPLPGAEVDPAFGGHDFVYLLGFPDAAGREVAWAAFLAHPKWPAVKAKAGTPPPWKKVVATVLRSLPYSPDVDSPLSLSV